MTIDPKEADRAFDADLAGEPSDPDARDGVRLVKLSAIRSEPVRWLWPGWLARGKLHVLAGAPGTGKTTLALGLAATLSMGARWPDGTKAPVGNIVIWSGEDDISDTLAPRLRAAGADEDRIHVVGGMVKAGKQLAFDPARDLPALADAAARLGDVAMLLVDPLVAALGDADSHRNAETRNALAPLVELGQQLDAAVIGITHHSKGTAGRDPVERVTGSIAFGALARIVLSAAKREEVEPGQASRMLVRSKSNIGPDGGGFGYDLLQHAGADGIDASTVVWGAEIEGTARALLAAADASSEGPGRPDNERQEAKGWLADMLAGGPVAVAELKEEAKAAGMSWRTVETAKSQQGVIAFREGEGRSRPWFWRLPGNRPQHPSYSNSCGLFVNEQVIENKESSCKQNSHEYIDRKNSGVPDEGQPGPRPTGREKGTL